MDISAVSVGWTLHAILLLLGNQQVRWVLLFDSGDGGGGEFACYFDMLFFFFSYPRKFNANIKCACLKVEKKWRLCVWIENLPSVWMWSRSSFAPKTQIEQKKNRFIMSPWNMNTHSLIRSSRRHTHSPDEHDIFVRLLVFIHFVSIWLMWQSLYN